MKKIKFSYCTAVIIIFFFINIIGCSNTPDSHQSYRDLPYPHIKESFRVDPPGGITIKTEVQNYLIINHKILDNDPNWGKFRFAGKFSYLNELVFKFKSNIFPEYYWLARMPSLSNGEIETRAILYEEPGRDLKKPPPPPKRLSISAVIREGAIINHSIQNPHPGWGVFVVAKYELPIIFVKNPFYEGCEWQGKLPLQDGSGEFYLILQIHSCIN